MATFRLLPRVSRRPTVRPVLPWPIRLRAALTRRARGLGLLLVVAAAATVLLLPRPEGGSAGAQVVTSRDLPLGSVVKDSDLVLRPVTGQDVTSREAAEEERRRLVGTTLAVPASRGDALSSRMTVGPKLTTGLPRGQVATGVRVRDPQSLALFGPGSAVSIIGSTAEGQPVEAEGTLLWIPPQDAGASGSAAAAAGSAAQDLALVAVTGQDARRLATASGTVVVVRTR